MFGMKFNTNEVETDLKKSSPFYITILHNVSEIENSNRSLNISLINRDGVNYPQEIVVLAAICMFLLSILGIMVNFFSIWAFCKSKRLRRIMTAFVVNLCVADLFQSCCTLASSRMIYTSQHWNGGDITCKFHNILIFFFVIVSMLTVITITANRYVLVVHPRFYDAIFDRRNAAIMLGSLWTISGIIISLRHLKIWGEFGYDPNTGECAAIDQWGNTDIYIFVSTYIVPLVLFALSYTKIFYVVMKTERSVSMRGGNTLSYIAKLSDKYWLREQGRESAATSYNYLRNRKERRIFQMIMVIFICFALCFMPLCVVKMLRKEKEYPSLYIVCRLGLPLSSSVNPIIYFVMSEEYRRAYKDLFRCGNNTKT